MDIAQEIGTINKLFDEAIEKANKGETDIDIYSYISARYKGIDPETMTVEQRIELKPVRAAVKQLLYTRIYGHKAEYIRTDING